MKTARIQSVSIYAVLLTAALVANLGVVGCSEDEPVEPGGGGSVSISVDEIIFNPKSPSLGDTMLATAVVTGNAAPGDFVTYSWTASGGTLVDTDKSVVRWVAPMTSQAVQLSVTARNSASSASGTQAVFVSDVQTYLNNRGGELKMSVTGDSLISQYSPQPPDGGNFVGWGIRVNEGANERIVLAANQGGFGIRFSRRFDRAAYNLAGNLGLIRMNYVDLVSGARTALPNTSYNQRGPQYTEAEFHPGNSDLMTYQVWWPDKAKIPQIGGVDSFQIVVYDIPTAKEKRVVTLAQNFHPTFSTDGNWLLFVSNRADPSRTDRFDYYKVAVNGTDVDTDSLDGFTRLTTGGRMGPDRLVQAWSPTASILAVVDDSGALWLINADGSGASTVATTGNVTELTWAPSGNFLVMAASNRLYRVTAGGQATLIQTAPSGDRISRLAVSGGEDFLLYLVRRLTQNWYELLDLSGVTGLTDPLRISSAAAPGKGNQYSNVFSLSPVWTPNAPKAYMLSFDGGVNTPIVNTMDFSNLLPTP